MSTAFSPVVYRSRVAAFKQEATPGTAETLDSACAVFEVHDAKYLNVVDTEHRPKEGAFGEYPAVISAKRGRMTFKTHLFGGTAQPAMMDLLLPAVGFGYNAGAYGLSMLAPSAPGSPLKTLTAGIVMAQGGLKRFIYGAMGTMKLTVPASKLVNAEFDLTGIKGAQADATVLTPTYTAGSPLLARNTTLTIGALAMRVSEMTLDMANKISVIQDAASASGYYYAMVGDRLVTGTLKVLAGNIAYSDILGAWENGTQSALAMTLRAINGDTGAMAASALQLIDPEEGEQEGKQMWDLKFQLNADDLSFTFGNTPTSTSVPPTSTT